MFGRSKIYSDESEFEPTDSIFLQTYSLFVWRDKLIVITWKEREEGYREMERTREKSERGQQKIL